MIEPRIYCLVAVAGVTAAVSAEPPADEATIRAAIERALPPLQLGAKTFRERSEGRCISCHHQGLVLRTLALARERGFAVDERLAREEVERVHGFYARRIGRYRAALEGSVEVQQADPFGNFTVHAGYWLSGLAAEKAPRDEALDTAVQFLMKTQTRSGSWTFTDLARAPMQSGDITVTALAAAAMKNYGPADSEEASACLGKARAWLVAAQPRTTDDKAFRLLGLLWSGASSEQLHATAAQLLADQRDDGGWGQQDNMPSDCYATGLALTALQQSGEISPEHESQRAVEFLLMAQHADGTWFVKTRAIPTNPYFKSGFPYGKSQFISYAASCWSTMALLGALRPPANVPNK